jgi:hypothetical protein
MDLSDIFLMKASRGKETGRVPLKTMPRFVSPENFGPRKARPCLRPERYQGALRRRKPLRQWRDNSAAAVEEEEVGQRSSAEPELAQLYLSTQ